MVKIFFAVMGSIILMGCGSLSVHEKMPMTDCVSDPRLDSPSPIFGGVTTDSMDFYKLITVPTFESFFCPLFFVDLPLSLVLDICYLPSDMYFWSQWSDYSYDRARNHKINQDFINGNNTNVTPSVLPKPAEAKPTDLSAGSESFRSDRKGPGL